VCSSRCVFDWSVTDRKIVVFIPNYSRKSFLVESMKYFHTGLDEKDYIVVVGNDGIEEDFSSLGWKNVVSFTLHRTPPSVRNGGFIRNYFIKRCQSEYVFQKDPEVVIAADFLAQTVASDNITRCGRQRILAQAETEGLISGRIPIEQLQQRAAGIGHAPTFIHYGFGIKTSTLQQMRGYDERFLYYGYEDTDLYNRLVRQGYKMDYPQNLCALHMWHVPMMRGMVETQRVYDNEAGHSFIANPNGWGEG